MGKSVSELFKLTTYEDRLAYLMFEQVVGDRSFGGLRSINQAFYKSREWLHVRASVITRDDGLDLGLPGYIITGVIYVHHLNPITPRVLLNNPELALDPEYLITTSFDTHQQIHYGRRKDVVGEYKPRKPGDTTLW